MKAATRVTMLFNVLLFYSTTLSMEKEYKDLHQDFVKRGLDELSPIRGVIGLSHLIKNRLVFADPLNPYVCAAQKLFNVVTTQLNATTYEPYVHFGPDSIGCLVSALYSNKLHDCTQDIKDCDVITDLKQSFKGKNRAPRLKQLLKALHGCVHEEHNNRLCSGSTLQLLLAFLWKKDSRIGQLEKYKEYIFERIEPVDSPDVSETNYLNCFDLFLKTKHQCFMFAPELDWQRNIATGDGTLSCDCFYTAVRQLLNDLLFHSLKGRFQVPSEVLTDFYDSSLDASEHITSPEVRSQWTVMIESIPDLERCAKHDAVRPSLDNLSKILQALFPYEYETLEWSLAEFCKDLSAKTDHEISINPYTIDHETELEFQVVPRYERNPYKVSLYITAEHAYVVRSGTIDYKKVALMRKGIIPKTEEFIIGEHLDKKSAEGCLTEFDTDCLCLFAPYTDFNKYYNPLSHVTRLLSLPMDSQEQMYRAGLQWIRALSYWHRTLEKKALHVLSSIFASLKNNDYVLALFVRLIQINYHHHPKIKELILQYNEHLDHDEQNDILYELAQKQAWHDEDYNELMITIAKRVPDREVVNRTARIAFEGSNLTKLYLDLARAECPLDSSLAKCVLHRIKTEGTDDELRRVQYLAPFLRSDGVYISDHS